MVIQFALISIWLSILGFALVLESKPASASTSENESQLSVQTLGKALFFDKRLSEDGKIACASCHRPETAFSDGFPLPLGTGGRRGIRNTPSLLNVGVQRSLFWDGRIATLEQQVSLPLFSPLEHGLTDGSNLLAKLRSSELYRSQFLAAFGPKASPISIEQVEIALAAYLRTLTDTKSPFDLFLEGQTDALSRSGYKGWLVFSGSGQCTRCHKATELHPMFTDHDFHALSVGLPTIERKLPELTKRLFLMRSEGKSAEQALLGDSQFAELGRFVVTLLPTDIGKFKTPSLRNVALTAPYMHDGSVGSLSEAVDLELYYRGNESGRPLIITPTEKEDLLAFLRSLTSVRLLPPTEN